MEQGQPFIHWEVPLAEGEERVLEVIKHRWVDSDPIFSGAEKRLQFLVKWGNKVHMLCVYVCLRGLQMLTICVCDAGVDMGAVTGRGLAVCFARGRIPYPPASLIPRRFLGFS